MRKSVIALVLCLVAALMLGCGNGKEANPTLTPMADTTAHANNHEPVVITIGDLSDLTGVSANAMGIIDESLEDMVKYYNDQNIIPGVRLKIITYDGQFNPSRDIPGYEWLKDKGADLIFTAVPATSVTLKPRVDKDKMVLFALAPSEGGLLPPGYAFCPGYTYTKNLAYTALKWIAENDPDFPRDRPARIGGAAWAETYSESSFEGAKEYAKAHPEQYEWEGGYLTDFVFTWGPEVSALKDCDYVFPPVVMNSFVKEYRAAGYAAKFISLDAQTAFFGLVDKADLWNDLDGMLFLRTTRWWNEDEELISLIKKVLYEYRSDEAEDIIRMGSGYLGGYAVYMVLDIIAKTVETVGPGNFDSQALYKTAESFSLNMDGAEHHFGEDKRASADYAAMYELRAAEKDIFRVSPDWYPILLQP